MNKLQTTESFQQLCDLFSVAFALIMSPTVLLLLSLLTAPCGGCEFDLEGVKNIKGTIDSSSAGFVSETLFTSFLNIYFYVHIDLCGPSGYLASHLCLFSPSFSAQCFLRITMWYIDIQDTCSVTPIRWVVYIGSAHIDLIYPVHFNLLLKPTWGFFLKRIITCFFSLVVFHYNKSHALFNNSLLSQVASSLSRNTVTCVVLAVICHVFYMLVLILGLLCCSVFPRSVACSLLRMSSMILGKCSWQTSGRNT